MRAFLGVALAATLVAAPAVEAQGAGSSGSHPDVRRHAPWDALVKDYVSPEGWVSYAKFHENEERLDAYLQVLAETDPGSLPEGEQLTLWINAYNAYTVKLILKKYPDIQSIRDFWRPWKGHKWTVGGKEYTLDHMEHQILRKRFDEPRIHFAINCASKSCPDLIDEAYVAPRIQEQLATVTTRFLSDEEKGLRVAREEGSLWGWNNNVYLSKIFSWFGDDFERASGSVLDWVKAHASPEARAFMEEHAGDLTVQYLDYDWALNGE